MPKHKSVPDDSPFGRALDDRVEETASLGILVNSATDPIHISAGCYPYTDHRGEQHMRVLALITPARSKPGISRGH